MGFERKIILTTLQDGPLTLKFDADEGERLALAKRFDLLELKLFKGEATATQEKGGAGIAVQMRFKAKLVQRCGITLEPVHDVLSETFFVRFVEGPVDEIDLDPESDEDREALEDGEIDIGEIAAQYLGTAVNPYPRKKGSRAMDLPYARGKVISEEKAGKKANPFSLLKKLRDRD